CDYDLRGLAEPRCPECGYRFVWEDLTDPTRRRHPYLFEHHPRHNVWSFARTMLGGLRPERFWSSLKPSQPSRPGRLLLYWCAATVLLPIGYGAMIARTAVADASDERGRRATAVAYATRMGQQGALLPEWVDEQFPEPFSVAYLRLVYQRQYAYWFGVHLEIAVLYAAWPWLTLAVLLIFRASMRRAKVRAVHVLRC